MIIPFRYRLLALSVIASFIQILLFPILLWQGNKVRDNAKNLPEASGKRLGKIGKGKTVNILILGDSSACGVGVKSIDESLAGYLVKFLTHRFTCKWKIIAKSGIKTSDLTELVKKAQKRKFDVALVSVGINDITSGCSARMWHERMLELSQVLLKDLQVSYIIFCGIPPVRKLTIIPFPLKQLLSFKAFIFDLYLEEMSMHLNEGYFVPHDYPVNQDTLAEDLFHPGKIYYKNWAKKISETIIDIF